MTPGLNHNNLKLPCLSKILCNKNVFLNLSLLAGNFKQTVLKGGQEASVSHIGSQGPYRYITLGWKGLPVTNTLAFLAHS